MEEKDIIASNIIFYRKKMGLSQLELAEKLCYSNKNISKWEKGETTPSVFTLKKLAEIFNITLDELTSLPKENNEIKNELDKPKKIKKNKKKQSLKVKLEFLLLANAILLIVAFIVIYILALAQVESFNKWYMLLFVSPLSALSVVIFIRCIFKYVDYISISLIPWLSAFSLYIPNISVPNVEYIFLVAAAANLLVVTIAMLVNHHLIAKFQKNHFWDKPIYPNDDKLKETNVVNEKINNLNKNKDA